MSTTKIVTLLLSITTVLTGCETMFAHFRLNEQRADQIAKGNAATNFCLANGAINKNMAYAFNNISAQLLDITVFDRDFYKNQYQLHFSQFRSYSQSSQSLDIRSECAELEKHLPSMIESVSTSYMSISTELHAARSQERQQIASMLSTFGRGWNQQSYSQTTAVYSYPNITFSDQKPEVINYIVNTSKGLVQCKITSKNYVFCL